MLQEKWEALHEVKNRFGFFKIQPSSYLTSEATHLCSVSLIA